MSVVASRGNSVGKTEITTALAAATANTGVVLISVPIDDILALAGVSNAEKKLRAYQRADDELRKAIEAAQQTDAALDQRVTDTTATVAALKAARATGNL